MHNQIETATKAATALIKAGAIQPVVGFFCFQMSVTFVEPAGGVVTSR